MPIEASPIYILNVTQTSQLQTMNTDTRGRWASKTEFVLSCMGYAIGIGNVWRFPYLCYRNGGGAFLVPYLLMLLLCGIPLFFLETSLGQFASTGCITIFKIAPLFKGTGHAIIVVNFICTTYYNVITSYPLLFLFHCFAGKLPWIDCDNPWNTENCAEINRRNKTNNLYLLGTRRFKTPADEFFHNKILQITDGVGDIGSIVWPMFVCNAIVWIVVFVCVAKGVKSVGKVVYFTVTFPFVLLFVLLLRGMTLPGAWSGISFYIYPKWDELLNLKVWADSAMQMFFSLGPGWGCLINMASYNNFRSDNKRDSILVPVLNCATSILAGFVVFSVLGFMSHETGLPVSSVATGGPGLAFVAYPEAISTLPWAQFWAVLFFIMLFLLGLDSCFVQLEAIISSITDEYPSLKKHKTCVTSCTCIVMFLSSTIFVTNGGMYYLQLFDWYSASISVILICIIEVFIVGWTYGARNFARDVEFMTQTKLHWWWLICWKYVTPAILTFIFITAIAFNTDVTYNGVVYPEWSINLGWFACFSSMVWIPYYIGYKLYAISGLTTMQKIKWCLLPAEDWGPVSRVYRKEWKDLMLQKNVSTQSL